LRAKNQGSHAQACCKKAQAGAKKRKVSKSLPAVFYEAKKEVDRVEKMGRCSRLC
jgi:hypothetical protein